MLVAASSLPASPLRVRGRCQGYGILSFFLIFSTFLPKLSALFLFRETVFSLLISSFSSDERLLRGASRGRRRAAVRPAEAPHLGGYK